MQPPVFERHVLDHAAEVADIDLSLAQGGLGVDRRDDHELHLRDVGVDESLAVQPLLDRVLVVGALMPTFFPIRSCAESIPLPSSQ